MLLSNHSYSQAHSIIMMHQSFVTFQHQVLVSSPTQARNSNWQNTLIWKLWSKHSLQIWLCHLLQFHLKYISVIYCWLNEVWFNFTTHTGVYSDVCVLCLCWPSPTLPSLLASYYQPGSGAADVLSYLISLKLKQWW